MVSTRIAKWAETLSFFHLEQTRSRRRACSDKWFLTINVRALVTVFVKSGVRSPSVRQGISFDQFWGMNQRREEISRSLLGLPARLSLRLRRPRGRNYWAVLQSLHLGGVGRGRWRGDAESCPPRDVHRAAGQCAYEYRACPAGAVTSGLTFLRDPPRWSGCRRSGAGLPARMSFPVGLNVP